MRSMLLKNLMDIPILEEAAILCLQVMNYILSGRWMVKLL